MSAWWLVVAAYAAGTVSAAAFLRNEQIDGWAGCLSVAALWPINLVLIVADDVGPWVVRLRAKLRRRRDMEDRKA